MLNQVARENYMNNESLGRDPVLISLSLMSIYFLRLTNISSFSLCSVTSQIFSHRNQNFHFVSNRLFATSFQFNINLFLFYCDHCILLGAMGRKKRGACQNECTLSRRIKSPFPVWGKICIMCFYILLW